MIVDQEVAAMRSQGTPSGADAYFSQLADRCVDHRCVRRADQQWATEIIGGRVAGVSMLYDS
jgi:hypothetical protein